jgi:hypothetical protein
MNNVIICKSQHLFGKAQKGRQVAEIKPSCIFIHVGFNFNDSPAFYRFSNMSKDS